MLSGAEHLHEGAEHLGFPVGWTLPSHELEIPSGPWGHAALNDLAPVDWTIQSYSPQIKPSKALASEPASACRQQFPAVEGAFPS